MYKIIDWMDNEMFNWQVFNSIEEAQNFLDINIIDDDSIQDIYIKPI